MRLNHIRFFQNSKFYLSTWTGRILVVNAILFILISISSSSFFTPDTLSLINWGAKDPVSLAKGEWWRFFTPIFLHFGILHFGLNSLALKVIGSYLEPMIGGLWFLIIYIGSGIAGNVLSSLLNLSIGAGASGAIFGLIGFGVLFENMVMFKEFGRFVKMGPFTYMAVINFAFAIGLNFVFYIADYGRIGIDNAAHMGGLMGGVLLGASMLNLKMNRLVNKNIVLGIFFIIIFLISILSGSYVPFSTKRVYQQFVSDAEQSIDIRRSYYSYSQAIKINDSDPFIRFKRGRILALVGDMPHALEDLRYSSHFVELLSHFETLREELVFSRHEEDANAIQIIIEKMKRSKGM